MPKVKIVIADDVSCDYDDYYSTRILRDGITDWEEISDEDYEFLTNHKGKLTMGRKAIGGYPVIVVQDDTPIVERISSIKKYIKDEEERIQRERDRQAAIKAERIMKKQLAKQAKTEAEELRLLEALKEKYEPNKNE